MSASLSSERDIAKFFSMSSIQIRPDACHIILTKLLKFQYFDHKRAYLDQFLKIFKEKQSMNQNTLINGVQILD
jgi:hypothetical protein